MQDYDFLGNDDVPCQRRTMTICQRQILVLEPMTMQGWRTRRHTLESLVLNEVQYDSIDRNGGRIGMQRFRIDKKR